VLITEYSKQHSVSALYRLRAHCC